MTVSLTVSLANIVRLPRMVFLYGGGKFGGDRRRFFFFFSSSARKKRGPVAENAGTNRVDSADRISFAYGLIKLHVYPKRALAVGRAADYYFISPV